MFPQTYKILAFHEKLAPMNFDDPTVFSQATTVYKVIFAPV